MPDDHHPLMPRRNPEDIDLGAIKTDLEFLIDRFTRFRKEQALKPVSPSIRWSGVPRSSSRGSCFSRGTAFEACRSFGASRQSRRYSPSSSLRRDELVRRRDEEGLSRFEQRTANKPKTRLDRKSPIQVRIRPPPAASRCEPYFRAR